MKNLYFSLAVFCLPMILHAQDVRQITGYNYSSESYEAFNYYSTFTALPDHGHNKFVISGKGKKDTIMIIEIILDPREDIIYIKQINKKTNRSDERKLPFIPLSVKIDTTGAKPIYCIKNYRSNDTSLNLNLPDSTQIDILFTVADTSGGRIFLHQITTFDTNYHFSLDKFRNSYLKPHLEHARIYWQWRSQCIMDSLKMLAQNSVKMQAVMLARMKFKGGVDSLTSYISAKEKELPLKTLPADSISQNLFKERMDKIMSDYLYETHPVKIQTTGEYQVCVRENQRIDIIDKPTKKTTDAMFLSYFMQPLNDVEEDIRNLNLVQRIVTMNTDSSFRIILSNHKKRLLDLNIDSNEVKPYVDSMYRVVMDYRKQIEVPTLYTYNFSYTSSTLWQKWGKRDQEFTVLKTGEIIQEQKLMDNFNKELPQAKNGKYMVRLNSSRLNDSVFGPHIDTVYRKYKYLSHAGINVGTFITGNEFSSGEEAFDGSLIYFNLFAIYHHYGVFGGFTMKSLHGNTILNNFYEMGVYLAPGNYFFFKLGMAHNDGKISGLAGAALIFPFFQIETGYNFAMMNAYVMLGCNFPLNQ